MPSVKIMTPGILLHKIPCCISKNGHFKINCGCIVTWLRSVVTEAKRFSGKSEESKEDEYVVTTSNSTRSVLKISSGKLAKLADGSATVKSNGTAVLATVVSKNKNTSASFVPLTVSYLQKAAALGRIPINFLRREYRQTDEEILTSRVIDRSLRPFFPKRFNWETQVICYPLALDGMTFPDVPAINAASAALAVSNIPWNGPVAATRVGLIDDEIVINPSKNDLGKSRVNIMVTALNEQHIVMVEGSAMNLMQNDFLKVIEAGINECVAIVSAIRELKEKCGKTKRTLELPDYDLDIMNAIKTLSMNKLGDIFNDHSLDKLSRDEAISELQKKVLSNVKEDFSDRDISLANEMFLKISRDIFREVIFETEIRCDGRALNDVRKIECEVNLFDSLHGSALFQRGQSQVLCTVALGSQNYSLKMDKIAVLTSGLKEKNFFVHYEFLPFATKDLGRAGAMGRREIGHGNLAEKALKFVVPNNFPFAIRLTSEVLESNGSTSMATVCGGSLALMDAGIPMKNACAGIAMGLVTKSEDENVYDDSANYKILTDLLGIEDFFGDMDFKIAGTSSGITAVQMDVKNTGIPLRVFEEILSQARDGINHVLQKMNSVLSAPRENKTNKPVLDKVVVQPHLRGKFVGLGGINIKKLELETGVELTEENPGEFIIFAPDSNSMKEAKAQIQAFLETTAEPVLEFGGVYTAEITQVKESGCLVTLYPNMKPVFIHVSQLDIRKVEHPSALGLDVGQEIQVKYFGRDPVSGMMRLSRKVLQATASQVVQNLHKKNVAGKSSGGENNDGSDSRTDDSPR